jgi:zinc-ribbon domain
MAGFCRNCGSPLDDGQGFCTRCGTPASGPPVRSSAAPPPGSSVPPAQRPQAVPQPGPQSPTSAPQAAGAPPAKSGNTLVKVLLVFVAAIFLFGVLGIAGIWYVAHRAKQKIHEMGLDDLSTATNEHRGPALGGTNPCSLLSKEDVAQAVKMDVVRSERPEGSDAGCEYSVMGNYVDLIAKHASLLQKEQTNESQKQMMETFAKAVGHSNDSQQSVPRHPGESPAFMFSVDNNSAAAQMSLSRATFGRMGPAFTPIPSLGDDAFDIANGIIMVRKGNTIIRIIYMMCPCTTDDVVPLARKIVSNM